MCRYILGSHEDAEDASSEVFARLPRALKTYDRSLPFPRWLTSVASHYCIDLLRRRKSELRVLAPVSAEPETYASASSTMLSSIVVNPVKFSSAAGAASVRSHQPGLDRTENLFPRRTRSFFYGASR
ncbi:MAG: RNA polymerase sigma factor [Terriglobales bacterium]